MGYRGIYDGLIKIINIMMTKNALKANGRVGVGIRLLIRGEGQWVDLGRNG